MYKKGTGNDKQGKDAGNRTLCPYRNFSQAIKEYADRALFHLNRTGMGGALNIYSINLFLNAVKRNSVNFFNLRR